MPCSLSTRHFQNNVTYLMIMNLTNEIQKLPKDWALTPVRGKQCIRKNWQSEQPLSRKRLNEIIQEDLTITGYALRFGSFSGNLIGLDLDGESAISLAEELGFSLKDTVSCTSGKQGRRLEILKAPDNFPLDFYKAKIKIPAEVEGEAIEIRLHRSCSCIPPSIHPETNQPYYWLNSPEEHQVKAAPKALLQEIIKNPVRSEETELAVDSKTNNVELNKALDALLSLDPRRADDYDSWFEVACAFKHACYKAGLGEIGWLFFELWSRQSDSYRSWDGRHKWGQITANGGTKVGSLFQWSQEDGNEPPQRSLASIGIVQAKEVCQQILNSPLELFEQNYQLICETFKAIRESLLIQWVELNNHFDFELDDALDAWGDADYSSGDWDALQRLIGRETTEQEQPDASDMSNSTEDNQGKLKVGQKLLAAISYREVEFYLNQDEQAWVDFPHKGVIAASPVDSPILRKWLRAIYWEDYQDVIGDNPLEEVIATLEATTFADDSSPQKQTGIRVIKVEDAIYIDLGSDSWEVIEVTAQGWRVLPMDDTPVRFKRNKFTKALPVSAENGDIAKFRSYCNKLKRT